MKIGEYTEVDLPDFPDMQHLVGKKWKERRKTLRRCCGIYFLFWENDLISSLFLNKFRIIIACAIFSAEYVLLVPGGPYKIIAFLYIND